MEIEANKEAGIWVLNIEGELDLYNAPFLRDEFDEKLSESGKLILNLKETTFIDSSGIGCLVSAVNRIKKKEDGEIAIINIEASVLKIIKVTKIDKFFSFYDSLAEAITKMQ